jgi:U3 small nucleolar RNA-associated protein 12
MQSRPNILVSSSKDTFVKFWDLSVQHCFKTLAGHVTEVWDFALVRDDAYLVRASYDVSVIHLSCKHQ